MSEKTFLARTKFKKTIYILIKQINLYWEIDEYLLKGFAKSAFSITRVFFHIRTSKAFGPS